MRSVDTTVSSFFFWGFTLLTVIIMGCSDPQKTAPKGSLIDQYNTDAKPYTRWWWFATAVKPEDVKHQLDWLKAHQFGGVEIAWVYPLYRYQRLYEKLVGITYAKDTSAYPWLGEEWRSVVSYTKRYADSIGLGCDFTVGSAWPAAASYLDRSESTRIYGDTAFKQVVTFSWEYPARPKVLNHLDSNAFRSFIGPIAEALGPAVKGGASALFTDSWEIKMNHTNKIWTPGFDTAFQRRFGYNILPYMDSLDSFPDVRYDYMMLMSDYVMNGFYQPYIRNCRKLGALSRVQCLAAPADILSAYAQVDIPETEAMLNNPPFSRIVSSAACLGGKKIVSAEAFTCMYGFPSTYMRQEQVADLKLVADALFAQGVNQIIYHGMPFNPAGSDTNNFFATVYVGPDGNLTDDLPAFNQYLQKVSRTMRYGRTYTDVAVYIPFEDGIMKGAYPPERQRVWVWGAYELRYVYPAAELRGRNPIWINRDLLNKGIVQQNKLVVGEAVFNSLYVDVRYLDSRSLSRILELAREGLPVCVRQKPLEPGKNPSTDFDENLEHLLALDNVSSELADLSLQAPLLSGDSLPDFWVRTDDAADKMMIFFAHPKAKDLAYPIYSGQSFSDKIIRRKVTINAFGKSIPLELVFQPYQSLAFSVHPDGRILPVDIRYQPPVPEVKPREPQKMYF